MEADKITFSEVLIKPHITTLVTLEERVINVFKMWWKALSYLGT